MADLGIPLIEHWKNLSPEEKIERIRRMVKTHSEMIEDIKEMIAPLEKHSHLDGKIVIQFERGYGRRRGLRHEVRDKDEVYF